MINAMANTEMQSNSDAMLEFKNKAELINELHQLDYRFTTNPEAFKESSIKAYQELQEPDNDNSSSDYIGGYWTDAAGYDEESKDINQTANVTK